MPTYDYRCTSCNHAFEHFQSMSSPLLKKCPKCAKSKLERLIGAGAGLLFKGSGFYITDYRSSSYQDAAKKDGAPAAAPTGATTPPATGSGSNASPAPSTPATSGSTPPASPSSTPSATPAASTPAAPTHSGGSTGKPAAHSGSSKKRS